MASHKSPISCERRPPGDRAERLRFRSVCVRLIPLAVLLGLPSCAHVPADPAAQADYERNDDPAEPTNRVLFAGNQSVDHHALQPVARGYTEYVPGAARRGIHNLLGNLEQPGIAVNDVLQGNVSRAWTTTQRFAINTVVGGAGVFDVATGWNRPGHAADFGQTLGVWGVGPGPAVQLPLFGPSNVRDSVGKVVGMVTDPVTLATAGLGAAVTVTKGVTNVVDSRATLLPTTDSLEHNSLDYYATLRTAMAQHRAALVAQGEAGLVAPQQGVDPGDAIVVHTSPSPSAP
jgi:phospholipid-binding lipoprotein MlaA